MTATDRPAADAPESPPEWAMKQAWTFIEAWCLNSDVGGEPHLSLARLIAAEREEAVSYLRAWAKDVMPLEDLDGPLQAIVTVGHAFNISRGSHRKTENGK